MTAEYRAKITVVPKPVKLVSAKNVRGRKVKAVWKKGSMITGYELQYSLKKNFRGAKTKTIKKAKVTKLTIKKLKKKKTYYFRIRTYKKIGKTMYRSSWSNKKVVKIKK